MTFAADLHLHSRWSRATSRAADLDGYRGWAQVKGLTLLAAGDFTHPQWRAELESRLVERDGLYEIAEPRPGGVLEGATPADRLVRFILVTEISSIYKKAGATRKVHSLVGVPSLEVARRLSARLATVGNVASDGRPILGLDPKDLLSMVLDICPDAFLVPAHIWTPWFSIFGSKSGFDRIEECFEDLTPQVFALEAGLSSDVPMNRRWSALDRYRLISCSDAHSPGNLGREATRFDTELSWRGVVDALRTGAGYRGTLEFYPEEGKYHYDGHRRCGVCQDPAETLRRGEACPVCGKPLTVGVLNRVLALADREEPPPADPLSRSSYIVPLPELLAEIVGVGPGSQSVMQLYARVVSTYGSEYAALTEAPLEAIQRDFGATMSESIRRVRDGRVNAEPGYDGEFGVVRVFTDAERRALAGEGELFVLAPAVRRGRPAAGAKHAVLPGPAVDAEPRPRLDPEQAEVVAASEPVVLVRAGPGAGKTRTLTEWVARQVECGAVAAREVLAITFTNRAAAEMRARLAALLGGRARGVTVATFHAFCWGLLRSKDPGRGIVYGPRDREDFLRLLLEPMDDRRLVDLADRIGGALEGTLQPDAALAPAMERYRAGLEEVGAADLSALIADALDALRGDEAFLAETRSSIRCLAVDELQDINGQQYELLRMLMGPRRPGAPGPMTLCIGDPDQAIYGFRGSDRGLFERFGREAQARAFTLRRNHRSTGSIACAASAIIGGAPAEAVGPRGERLRVHAAREPDAEAGWITATIEELVGGVDHVSASDASEADGRGGGRAFSDIAVLFRTRVVRDSLLPVFERAGIPFTLREGSPLCSTGACRLAVAALRVVADPRDRVALARVGERSGALAERLGGERDALLARVTCEGIEPVLAELAGPVEPEDKLPLELLRETARECGADLPGFLRRLALAPAESEGGTRTERVRLLTFHAAKGMEFPVVFIAGAEEGITPIAEGRGVSADEERRLFYVAMTRARELLYLSHCATRRLHGRLVEQRPSRFLAELPADCVEQAARRRAGRAGADQLRLF